MKTLADMTEEERTQCRGMWCETAISKALFIYVASDQDNEEKAVVVNPKSQFRTVTPLRALTPRPDLPRAWNPDGTPPAGEWEYAEYLGDHGGMTDVYYFDGEPTHRHWISEWEKA
nr:MAG TPA: Putative transmembrane protein precursor [Caudoviricetes sp.]